jgi:hypothetical protein
VSPTSLAGIARIEEPSENDARENQDGAAHSDVPKSGLTSATGARLVPLYRCSFRAAITLVSVAVPIAMPSPLPALGRELAPDHLGRVDLDHDLRFEVATGIHVKERVGRTSKQSRPWQLRHRRILGLAGGPSRGWAREAARGPRKGAMAVSGRRPALAKPQVTGVIGVSDPYTVAYSSTRYGAVTCHARRRS